MQENLTSSEALHEYETGVQTEQTESKTSVGRTTSFGDTLTLQAILCVLLALGFIAVNMINGNLAAEVFELYESKLSSESTVVDVFAAIVDFLGSAPINNV
ncbi:MAG: hypothetical protein K2N26_03430 [Oscillospiraceae bacterium]|nr:hypothetical protein [Oscillospiraceae bacterium]